MLFFTSVLTSKCSRRKRQRGAAAVEHAMLIGLIALAVVSFKMTLATASDGGQQNFNTLIQYYVATVDQGGGSLSSAIGDCPPEADCLARHGQPPGAGTAPPARPLGP